MKILLADKWKNLTTWQKILSALLILAFIRSFYENIIVSPVLSFGLKGLLVGLFSVFVNPTFLIMVVLTAIFTRKKKAIMNQPKENTRRRNNFY